MGLLFSIIAIAVLIILAIAGAAIPGLHPVFTVALPYLAIAIFIVGVIVRVLKWAKSPVPFRITTTSGQEKSLPWIKQNKLDNPSSSLGVIGRMALEVLFFRSLFRNTKAELKEGTKIAYGETKWLWAFGLLFHWSFLIVFLRHFRFFADPIPFFVKYLETLDGFFQIGVPIVYLTGIGLLVALTYLFLRRIFDAKVKYISLASDYFPLLLLIAIATTGIIMRYYVKTDLVAIKQVAVGILSFHPITPAETISPWFYIHFFLVNVLLIYFPMSKLMHMGGVFLSPTRNLANNNRMAYHENPWINDENYFKLHRHTYEEYEDEFRVLMKGAGLPLEKEVVNQPAKDGTEKEDK
ncbi:menaquinol oxidoreductase [Bacteroidetes/Chlorobi group bacterium ChocPot_Mid]|nr:MAG: menaquinol oxidoreductase [Bacteroidetes/Chlorobi group bacterium ChocPot_Mid]